MKMTAKREHSGANFCNMLPESELGSRERRGHAPEGGEADSVPEIIDGASVDVEDYYHVEAFADRVNRAQWPLFVSRVHQNTERTLDLLRRTGTRATFFVLGYVAERHPEIVRNIAEAGHEVACHSHLHRRVHTLSPNEFREDIRRARGAIENAAGVKVVGFRAPTFSITLNSLWALDILLEEGFEYDSSIFPVRHDLYGIPDAPRFVHQLPLPSGRSIWEIPMSTVRMGGLNLPMAGGGYLRLLPLPVTRWAIRRVHRRDQKPVIVYFHPWELDPEQPRLNGKWKSRFRHYTGLRKTESRLEKIFRSGSFQPLIELVRRAKAAQGVELRAEAANHQV